ncbi:hypothetical protein NPX13_g11286 [Xylaria arbuscula]|uniref:Integrase catalytic domain-containing protein n=1 Tax=Xylaria arbuscula TaxID=114810 RepID=A0A9W8TFZ0_9PEZI|nr:hypothetical protein NPX13_g11286 [Xylaria arbuscula]
MRLPDVAYCEDFSTNIVSLKRLQQSSYWWDIKPTPSVLQRRRDDRIACQVQEQFDQFILEYLPLSLTKQAFYSRREQFSTYTERKPSRTDILKWHLRLGHAGPDSLRHLMQESLGAKIKKDSEAEIAMTDCDACAQAKLRRQVRRTKQIRPSKPRIRIAIDFHDFEKTTQTESVIAAIERLIKHLWNRYQVKVKVIKYDNEILKHEDSLEALRDTFPDYEITFKPSAANTQGQNGAAERSGGVIKDKARAMRLSSNLPKSLWPEIMKAAIYLYNRSPKHIYNWKTPYERFHTYFMLRDGLIGDRKPKQAHLKAYGCKAYTLDSSNVQFQEKSFYTGNPEDLQKDARELLPGTIKILLAKRDLQETQPKTINKYPELDHEVYQNIAEDGVKEQGNSESKESIFRIQATGSEVTCEPDQLYTQAIFVPYPSPPESPTLSNLFTATIRKADLVVRPAEAALVAGKPRFKIKEDPFNLYTVVSARKSC